MTTTATRSPGPTAPVLVDQPGWATATWPLGARVIAEEGTTTFAVHAPAATRVTLELFAVALGEAAEASLPLARGADGVWRGELRGIGHGTLYGFRCWGRNWPHVPEWAPGSTAGFAADRDTDGNHFNPNKVLFDPYAREITHPPKSPAILEAGGDPIVFTSGEFPHRGRPCRELDSARWAPKGIVVDDESLTGLRPTTPPEDAIIYEAHVKNLTLHPSASRLHELLADIEGFEDVIDVPERFRGTYNGVALLAPYLRALGITTVELLPVHETDTDQRGAEAGSTNHWGYQTLGFFAPNRDYSSDQTAGGPTREFKTMIRALHAAGLEVYLDVVYNHSAEGGNWGGDPDSAAFTSLGGFATADYYQLAASGGLVDGATGTSNQLNFSSDAAQRLVLDSLAYWIDWMGVDGFRFDLATVLGRRPNDSEREDWANQRQFFADHPLLAAVRNLSVSEDIEVVAEAWDLWGYEVGNFPTGWGEWNGRFRDAVRAFGKGDGNVGAFMNQFNGDYLHFSDNVGPQKSVNFVDAHDGFTMRDLVSYNHKQNGQPWPFGPSDGGSDDNLSWDSGGDQALRRTRFRNNWVFLLFARGVPMVVSGDEYGRTQNGNNNPWALNTVGLWNNWAQAASNAPTQVPVDPDDPAAGYYYDVVGRTAAAEGTNPLLTFTHHLLWLRRGEPALRQRWWGDTVQGGVDVSYLYWRPDLSGPPSEGDRARTVAIDGAPVGGSDYLVLVNMGPEPTTFAVSDLSGTSRPHLRWHRIVDTAAWAEAEGTCWSHVDAPAVSGSYTVQPWAIAVLMAGSETP